MRRGSGQYMTLSGVCYGQREPFFFSSRGTRVPVHPGQKGTKNHTHACAFASCSCKKTLGTVMLAHPNPNLQDCVWKDKYIIYPQLFTMKGMAEFQVG